MSTLYTDNIRANNASQITIPTGQKIVGTDSGSIVAPGNVIQTVSYNLGEGVGTTFTNSTSVNMTSGNQTIGSGTITPTSSSNKILVFGHNVCHNDNNTGYSYLRIIRTVGSGNTIIQTPGNAVGFQLASGVRIQIPYGLLDSPATTNTVTYSHRVDHHGLTVDQTWNYGSMHMTLMEIAV